MKLTGAGLLVVDTEGGCGQSLLHGLVFHGFKALHHSFSSSRLLLTVCPCPPPQNTHRLRRRRRS
jgi:hypothetical protein